MEFLRTTAVVSRFRIDFALVIAQIDGCPHELPGTAEEPATPYETDLHNRTPPVLHTRRQHSRLPRIAGSHSGNVETMLAAGSE
jgi:hypothetical protein